MLLKLAFQNIKNSKGYFIAYMITISLFFAIIYQITNLSGQLENYFNQGIKMSGVSLDEMFGTVKIIMYIIITLFAAYISKFFVKRRSEEIAVLKTLGLSRKNIWLMFLIENTIIVLGGLLLGVTLGILVSRLFSIIAIDMIGFNLQTIGFSFTLAGIADVMLLLIIIYIVISIIPLYTISKSSITQLFNQQVSNDKEIKFPRISLILFIIFTGLLIYQSVEILGNVEFLELSTILQFLLNAVLVAFFLYRGVVVTYFKNYRKKQKGISSPVKLLSFNHLAANIGGVYKMMSFITIISGILIAVTMVIFGMFNQLFARNVFENSDISSNFVYATKDLKETNLIKNKLKNIDSESLTVQVYQYGKPIIEETDTSLEIKRKGIILAKKSDYLKYLEMMNKDSSKLKNVKAITDTKNTCNDKVSLAYCNIIKKAGVNNSEIIEDETIHDFMYTQNIGINKPKEGILNDFLFSGLLILEDNNKVFESLNNKYYLTNFKKSLDNKKVFDYYEAITDPNIIQGDNFTLLNDHVYMAISEKIVIGLFQIVSLLVMLVMIISLMMSIFFRTLENLEKGIDEYVIAQQLGLSKSSVTKAVTIEATITQVFPFLLGLIVSIPLFDRLFAFRFVGVSPEDAKALEMFSIITESSTLVIIMSTVIILIILVIILIFSITSRINRIKNVNQVR